MGKLKKRKQQTASLAVGFMICLLFMAGSSTKAMREQGYLEAQGAFDVKVDPPMELRHLACMGLIGLTLTVWAYFLVWNRQPLGRLTVLLFALSALITLCSYHLTAWEVLKAADYGYLIALVIILGFLGAALLCIPSPARQ